MQEFVFLPVDCEKGEGPAVAKKYGVRAYPTYVAVNGKGEVTDCWVGYDGPESWSQDALAAAADPRTIPQKKTAFDAEPSAELATRLANHAAGTADFPGAVNFLRRARELDAANAADYSEQILYNMYRGSRGDAFSFDEFEAEAKLALMAPDTPVEGKIDLAMMISALARQSEQPERAVPYITAALQASEGSTDEYVVDRRVELEISSALLVDKDAEKALKLYRTTFAEGWQENAVKLNQFAWWCFENDVNLAEAQKFATKGIKLAENDGTRAQILDTAAEICNKLGNCDEAVAHMKRAVDLSPDTQYYQDQLVRFEQVLAEKTSG